MWPKRTCGSVGQHSCQIDLDEKDGYEKIKLTSIFAKLYRVRLNDPKDDDDIPFLSSNTGVAYEEVEEVEVAYEVEEEEAGEASSRVSASAACKCCPLPS
jgi:hypothetical protein